LKQFSADQVMTVGGRQMNSRLYVDGTNLRTEMIMEGAGNMASIVNGEKQVIWMLMPGNMYMEKSVASDDDPFRARRGRVTTATASMVGTEKINGQECDKFRLKGTQQEMYLYTQLKTGFPVLMVTGDQSVKIEWKNVKPGPQPASLFQLPAGYKKLSMPALPGGFKLPGMK
jgi:hypothetical protein